MSCIRAPVSHDVGFVAKFLPPVLSKEDRLWPTTCYGITYSANTDVLEGHGDRCGQDPDAARADRSSGRPGLEGGSICQRPIESNHLAPGLLLRPAGLRNQGPATRRRARPKR